MSQLNNNIYSQKNDGKCLFLIIQSKTVVKKCMTFSKVNIFFNPGLIFCTCVRFEIKYFLKVDAVGVLSNTKLIFYG